MYYVYLFRCKDNSLYCGMTKDIKLREKAHNSGQGSMYVKSRGGGTIIYSEPCPDKSSALLREIEIKKYSKSKKELLVASVK